jgi:O-antigen ligase
MTNLYRILHIAFFILLIISAFSYVDFALTGLLLVVAVVISGNSIFSRNYLQGYSFTKLMLAYLSWLLFVALMSVIPSASAMNLAILVGLPVLYLVCSNISNFSDYWKILRIFFFVMGVGLGIWAIWQVNYHVGYGWAVGPLIDRNAFAALMNLLWFPAAYLFLSKSHSSKHWISILMGGGLFIISTALFATASRGGILIWMLLLPVFLWAGYQYGKSKLIITSILSIALAAYLSSSLILHSNVADRNFQILSPASNNQLSKDASSNARLLIWQSTIKMALDKPFYGTGWGTFGSIYPAYRLQTENTTSGFYAHNDYLQYAAEGGLPGFILLLALLVCLILQLKRTKKFVFEDSGFESASLLLAVLAIFLHAVVNFIFYFAFFNIIAGIYLARISQLSGVTYKINLYKFAEVRTSVKLTLASTIIFLISAPFALHFVSKTCLTGSQPGLRVINTFFPKVNGLNLANFITAVYSSEPLAQEYMMQASEYYLKNDHILNNLNVNQQLDLINEAIRRFELVRSQTSNDPNIGVREVKVLIEHHASFIGDSAYKKASQILMENLKSNPYHAKSMIMLAQLQVATGHKDDALNTLQLADQHILTIRDQLLIAVETLRQLAAPQVITELDEIEVKILRMVRSDSETGHPLILPPDFYQNIDERLMAIANKISSSK